MRRLDVVKRDIDPKDFLGRVPRPDELGDVIDESVMIYADGKPIMAYVILDEATCVGMRQVVATTHVSKSSRKNGIQTQSAVFGAMPRSTTRADYCRYTRNTHDEPENWDLIQDFGRRLAGIYREAFPDIYARALAEVEETVHEDWRIMRTPFLTCNVNLNHAIKFHLDTGNFRSALSNVFILKRGIQGGELVVPEYGFSLSQRDRALAIFDGQSVLHGVTPIAPRKGAIDPYRASIVYYTMNGMKKCHCMPEEWGRVKDVRTRRELMTKEATNARVIEVNKKRLAAAGYIPED